MHVHRGKGRHVPLRAGYRALRSDEKLELRLRESLGLMLYCRVKKLPHCTAKENSDLEVSGSENELDAILTVRLDPGIAHRRLIVGENLVAEQVCLALGVNCC